ncbi:hypothetical protein ROLI_042610 [Roseobacter fucihabitans]|uniref:Cadherin domain-containing protein n=2 Tax=Roseobacter fucihabitans TaxID=1537242 RepID=A0ABZ2C1G9_9RHOB
MSSGPKKPDAGVKSSASDEQKANSKSEAGTLLTNGSDGGADAQAGTGLAGFLGALPVFSMFSSHAVAKETPETTQVENAAINAGSSQPAPLQDVGGPDSNDSDQGLPGVLGGDPSERVLDTNRSELSDLTMAPRTQSIESPNQTTMPESSSEIAGGPSQNGDAADPSFEEPTTRNGPSVKDTGGSGDGADVATGLDPDTLPTGNGNDTFFVPDGFTNGTIIGGEDGEDVDVIDLTALSGPVTVTYTGDEAGTITDGTNTITFSQIEELALTDFADVVDGRADGSGIQINAGAGDDTVQGGTDADTLLGGDGDDLLEGWLGDDRIEGGAGADTIRYTGSTIDNDTIIGGEGGADDDVVDLSALTGPVTVTYTGDEAGTVTDGSDTITFSEVEGLTLTDQADVVNAGPGSAAMNIDAGAGDDTLAAGSGNDTLTGGSGDDTFLIDGSDVDGPGTITINGGSETGADSISGTGLNNFNWVSGPTNDGSGSFSGSFTFENAAGDTVTVNFSEIESFGGEIVAGNGVVEGTGGNDTMSLGYIDNDGDRITTGDDTIHGGAGADSIDASSGNDSVLAGDGNDTITAGDGDDTIDGGDGNDSISGGTGDDAITGGDGNDRILGNSGNDTLLGGAGNDDINGGSGNDSIEGGAGNDTINGGSGTDTIDGGAGNDTIYAFSGDDALSGGTDADSFLVYDPFGSGTLTGGEGGTDNDLIDLLSLTSPVSVTYTGNEAGTIINGADTITFSEIEQLILTDQADVVDASADSTGVQIDGGDGNDTITGGAGSDDIDGGDGTDIVIFSGDRSDYTITENAGVYTVSDNRTGAPDGTDTVTNVETFRFADGDIATENVLNTAPTDITSSASTVAENSAVGTVVATLSTTDANAGDTFTYAITNDPSGFFEIVGDEIRVASGADIDFETATSHDVTVQVTDAGGATYSETFTLTVSDTAENLQLGDGGVTFTDVGVAETSISGGTGNDSITAHADGGTLYGNAGDDIINGSGRQDVIDGGQGNDSIDGGTFSDTLTGGTGEDTIWGGGGHDIIDAGDGDDLVYGDAGDDNLDGGAGDDSLYGGEGNDTLMGGEGVDLLSGGAGDDSLDGGAGNDRLYGEAGNDTLLGGDGADLLDGGTGANSLDGGAGDDSLYGGEGNDTLSGGAGADEIQGGTGDDSIDGGAGGDWLYGDEGNDTLSGGDGADEIQGGIGDDSIDGGAGGDWLYGDEGNDTISGGDGADEIQGGIGDDSIDGGAAGDWLYGDEGNDTISGGDGADEIQGWTGDDSMDGGTGDDSLYGEDGNDTLLGGEGVDYLDGGTGDDSIDGGAADDTLYGGEGNDTLVGGEGADSLIGVAGVDSLVGGAGDDSLYSGEGNDTVYGGTGADYIDAGAGDDVIDGGTGNDTIEGGTGNDTIEGGTGNDTINASDGTGQIDGGTGDDVIDVSNFHGDISGGHYSDTGSDHIILRDGSSTSEIELGYGVDTVEMYDSSLTGNIDYGFGDTTTGVGNTYTLVNSTIGGAIRGEDAGGVSFDHTIYLENTDVMGWIDTGGGNDTVTLIDSNIGLGGVDELTTGAGDDSVSISGSTITEGVFLDDGDDVLTLGNNVVVGGSGIEGGGGQDLFNITGTLDSNSIDGGWGGTDVDTIDLSGLSGPVTVTYTGDEAGTITDGVNTITFSDIERLILTGGSDVVNASADTTGVEIIATDGNGGDTITGGSGNDTIYGSDEEDLIQGGAGDDLIYTGKDNDTVDGGEGSDTVYLHHIDQGTSNVLTDSGTTGTDRLVLQDDGANDTYSIQGTFSSAQGFEIIDGSQVSGETLETKDAVADFDFSGITLIDIDEIDGTSGNDTIIGSAGDDRIEGEDGNDCLYGGDGNDTLYGDDGIDFLTGGAGNDLLYGGDDSDAFFIAAMQGNDTVDGGAGGAWTDTINLEGMGAGATNVSGGTVDGDGWTLVLDGGHSVNSLNSGVLELSSDASGVVTFDDGGTVTFTDVERVTW